MNQLDAKHPYRMPRAIPTPNVGARALLVAGYRYQEITALTGAIYTNI